MSEPISVRIITPEEVLYEGHAAFLRIPGLEGEFGVFPGHQPMMTVVKTGELKIIEDHTEHYLFVSGGFVEVTPDAVVVLADVAERVENIDPKKVEEARSRAQAALEQNAGDQAAAAALERALFQMKLHEAQQHRRRSRDDLAGHLQHPPTENS